jgi:serine/threonine protein phosphatase PrpC
MEDAVAIVGGSGISYYAVFDGHGGVDVSRYAAYNLHRLLEKQVSSGVPVERGLTAAFADLDSRVSAEWRMQGSTAAVAVIVRDMIYTANVGDSRVILVEPEGAVRQMTKDHRASDADERESVLKRGGQVENGRVGGVLALSRSLGDGALKRVISAEPFLGSAKRREGQILIIACDGVWDVMENEEAAGIAKGEENPAAAAQRIVDEAVRRGTTDNVSVVVVFLRRK